MTSRSNHCRIKMRGGTRWIKGDWNDYSNCLLLLLLLLLVCWRWEAQFILLLFAFLTGSLLFLRLCVQQIIPHDCKPVPSYLQISSVVLNFALKLGTNRLSRITELKDFLRLLKFDWTIISRHIINCCSFLTCFDTFRSHSFWRIMSYLQTNPQYLMLLVNWREITSLLCNDLHIHRAETFFVVSLYLLYNHFSCSGVYILVISLPRPPPRFYFHKTLMF